MEIWYPSPFLVPCYLVLHYHPMRYYPFLLLLLGLSFFHCQTTTPPSPRPNIILIVTDDQGYGDFGVHGNRIFQTPHLDRLAAQSASLERFYVSPVCAPTRACLMTGRYNYRTRAIDTYVGRAQMDTEERTVAELLADGGYATGLFGKWHLGDCYPMRPQDQGFQEVLMHRGGGLAQPSEPLENERRYTDPILWHNGEQIQTEGYCTDLYFDYALDFIRTQSAAGKPFFSYIATNAPHGPFHDVPEDLKVKYMAQDLVAGLAVSAVGQPEQEQDRLASIAAMIENIDNNLGRLLTELDSLGQLDNTLLIFMTDNGPNTRRYVRQLRGMKSEVHEGGIRSPFFAHWPAQLQPGQSSDRIAAHIDLLPTLLEAAAVPLPKDLKLDGRSVLPLLKQQAENWPDRTLFLQTHRGDTPTRFAHFAAISQRYKLLHPTGFSHTHADLDQVPYELYDLEADPGEKQNLFAQEEAVSLQLKSAYDAWFTDVSATRPDNYAKPYIQLGSPSETVTVLTKQDWERAPGQTGWGEQGKWYVEVLAPGTYAVEVILQDSLTDWNFALQLGNQSWETTVTGRHSRTVLPEIPLLPGRYDLQGFVSTEQDTTGPYQLVLGLQVLR